MADAGTTNNSTLIAAECGLQEKVLLTTTCNSHLLLQGPVTYSSDKVYSYELGEKSSFFDRRMTVDLAAYYENWSNPILPTDVAGFTLYSNGGNAGITGVEAQLRSLLPLGFDLTLNAAYTHAEFLENNNLVGYPKDAQVPDTPALTASAVLSWKHSLPDGQLLFASFEEDYVGTRTDVPLGVTITVTDINQYLVHMAAYSVDNLRFGISGDANGHGKWKAALFVNNLTNNQALLDPQPQTTIQLFSYGRYSIMRPLTAGVDLNYQF